MKREHIRLLALLAAGDSHAFLTSSLRHSAPIPFEPDYWEWVYPNPPRLTEKGWAALKEYASGQSRTEGEA